MMVAICDFTLRAVVEIMSVFVNAGDDSGDGCGSASGSGSGSGSGGEDDGR